MATVLESFEDNDLSEYSGDTDLYNTTSDTAAVDGSYLLAGSSYDYNAQIYRSDVTVSTSDSQISAWLKFYPDNDQTVAEGEKQSFWFATQDSYGTGYRLQMQTSYNDFVNAKISSFKMRHEGSSASEPLVTDSSLSVDASGWFNVVVTQWDSNGNLTAKLKDSTGDEISTISANVKNESSIGFYDSGGIGWSFDTTYGMSQYADYTTKLQPPTAPQNVTVSQI